MITVQDSPVIVDIISQRQLRSKIIDYLTALFLIDETGWCVFVRSLSSATHMFSSISASMGSPDGKSKPDKSLLTKNVALTCHSLGVGHKGS